ncbi:hypothetical protein WR25_19646 [Diploscapter pachys]|uniref:Signal recognition particle subunit SRP68 n=1 Tax=Diploscapter pachys TaxID=2018661 RepID=A0A2A2LTS7_9BILA|nr:hypothetical protein WR25_19646 [Diploscapter pachys]
MAATAESQPQEGEPMDVGQQEQLPVFSTINILQIVKSSQDSHGLRYSDYNRYRKYCTSKLHRLRKSLKYGHQYKCVRKGVSVKFKKRPVIVEAFTDEMFAQIHLFEAERRWARAMYDRATLDVSPEKLRKRLSLRTSLKRAVLYATQLEELIRESPRCDAATKLEAKAYAASLLGFCCIELKFWQRAAEALKAANSIYDQLGQMATIINDEALQSLYRARCNEIKPQLRLCEHNAADAPGNVDEISQLLSEKLQISHKDKKTIDDLVAKARENATQKAQQKPAVAGQKTVKMQLKKEEKQPQTRKANTKQKAEKTRQAHRAQPTPKLDKPLFYDLAEFCILMPDLGDRIGEVTKEMKTVRAVREAETAAKAEAERAEREKKEAVKEAQKQAKAAKQARVNAALQQQQGGKKGTPKKGDGKNKEEEKSAEESGLSGMVKGWIWGNK